MPKLSELFTIANGIGTSGVDIAEEPTLSNTLSMLRPSNSFQGILSGFVDETLIPIQKIFEINSLMVSTNGEGSHSYSYVVPFRFTANSDVSVLTPIARMSVKAKLFYAIAITKSRWRFSFGRKPKGDRLMNLDVPDLPLWLEEKSIPDFHNQIESALPQFAFSNNFDDEDFCTVDQLFNVSYGNSYELYRLENSASGIAFVSRTRQNNGLSGRVSRTDIDPTRPGVLTVALGGSSAIRGTFLQTESTYQGRDVAILEPLIPMSESEKLWYCAAIRHHWFRFHFGRQANRQLSKLRIPRLPAHFILEGR